jgi:hypothetical protein
MHALTSHGLTCDGITGAGPQGTHAAPYHDTRATLGAEPTAAAGAVVVVLAVGDLADAPGGSGPCVVLGLCLAVLAIALLLLAGRRRGRARILDLRPRTALTRVASGRQDRPAPSLTLLCVSRC